jgi:nucleotide-binding universal stress UspA family protein
MATIVVGIEDSPRGRDAVALSSDLARATGAELLVVCAYPYDEREEAHYNLAMRDPLREAAEATLERLSEPLSQLPKVRRLAVADPSPARALFAVAESEAAALIVVGSSHSGFSGHVLPGSTARRLLNGAPCPVALAPQGHRLRPHLARGRVTVAFDGSPGAQAALLAAAPLAQAAGMSLRIVSVFSPEPVASPWLNVPPGYVRITTDAEQSARAALARAAESIPWAETAFLTGDAASELERESEASELLVIGSRGYGPAPAVLLGAVSGRLANTAACPLLIVPNGADVPADGLFGKLLTSLAV